MKGLFISNLNSFGDDQINNGGAGSGNFIKQSDNSLAQVLSDCSADSIENLSVAYLDTDTDPKAPLNFFKYLVGATPAESTVKFPEGVDIDHVEVYEEGEESIEETVTPLASGVKAVFGCDSSKAKYILCPGISATYFTGGKYYKVPLLIQIVDFNTTTGILKGKPVTGKYDSESNSYALDIAIQPKVYKINGDTVLSSDNILFALTDIPDLSKLPDMASGNVFILKKDCPSISDSAKAGDVFVFGQPPMMKDALGADGLQQIPDTWIKLYSMSDKLKAFLDDPEKTFKVSVAGTDYDLKPKVLLFDQTLSDLQYVNGRCTAHVTSATTSDLPASVISLSDDMKSKFYIGQKILFNLNLNGAPDSNFSQHPNQLVLMVIAKDATSGSPIVKPINAPADRPMLPSIKPADDLIFLDERPKVEQSIALVANDIVIKISDKVRNCKAGEIIAFVGGDILPVDFHDLMQQK